MSQPTFDRKYVRAGVVRRNMLSVVLAIVLAFMVGMTTWHTSSIVHGFTAKYVHTEGEVIDEGTETVWEGSRRSRHQETYRTVEIQFDYEGTTATDEVRSPRLQIGSTPEIWVEQVDGGYEVSLEKPQPVGFWGYFWGVVWLLLALGTAWLVVRMIRVTVALSKFNPAGRNPDAWFSLMSVQATNRSKRGDRPSARVLTLSGFATTAAFQQNRLAKVVIEGLSIPPVQQFDKQIPGFYVQEPAENGDGTVVLYAQRENLFYPAELTFPADNA